jgi:hypothetical protein
MSLRSMFWLRRRDVARRLICMAYWEKAQKRDREEGLVRPMTLPQERKKFDYDGEDDDCLGTGWLFDVMMGGV